MTTSHKKLKLARTSRKWNARSWSLYDPNSNRRVDIRPGAAFLLQLLMTRRFWPVEHIICNMPGDPSLTAVSVVRVRVYELNKAFRHLGASWKIANYREGYSLESAE